MRSSLGVVSLAGTLALVLAPAQSEPTASAVATALNDLTTPQFRECDIRRPEVLAATIVQGGDELSAALRAVCGTALLQELETHGDSSVAPSSLRAALAGVLNRALASPALPELAASRAARCSPHTKDLLAAGINDQNRLLFGRIVLEDQLGDVVGRFGPPSCRGSAQRAYGKVYLYEGTHGLAELDDAGRLSSLILRGSTTRSAPVALPRADDLVQQWLEQHGLPLQGWTQTRAERLERVSGATAYLFVWERLTDRGIVLPAITRVESTGEGQVTSLLRFDMPPQISLTPSVSQVDAERLAREAIHHPQATVQTVRCHVSFGKSPQQLQWDLVLAHDDQTYMVVLDAQSGRVIDAGPAAHVSGSTQEVPVKQLRADLPRLMRLEIVGLYVDGRYSEAISPIPLHPAQMVVGAIGRGDRLWPTVERSVSRGFRNAVAGGGLANEPPLWLRWLVDGEGYVYHATYDPRTGAVEFQTRDRWPQSAPDPLMGPVFLDGREQRRPNWPPSDSERLGVVCFMPQEFREAVLGAVNPAVAATLRRRLPPERSHGAVAGWLVGAAVLGAVLWLVITHLRRNPANSPIA